MNRPARTSLVIALVVAGAIILVNALSDNSRPGSLILAAPTVVWVGGLAALSAGAPLGFPVGLIGGMLFLNARLLLQFPGEGALEWLLEVSASIVGYTISCYEAAKAWRSLKRGGPKIQDARLVSSGERGWRQP